VLSAIGDFDVVVAFVSMKGMVRKKRKRYDRGCLREIEF
jgi:hypothetical protein